MEAGGGIWYLYDDGFGLAGSGDQTDLLYLAWLGSVVGETAPVAA